MSSPSSPSSLSLCRYVVIVVIVDVDAFLPEGSLVQARNIPIWSGCVGMLFLAVGIIEHDWAVGMSGYYEGGEVASEVASEVAR